MPSPKLVPQQPLLPMSLGLRDLSGRAWQRLLVVVREVVRGTGLKQEVLAEKIGVSAPLFSQALSGQRAFHAEWLFALLPFDHEHKIASFIAWESHCRLVPVETLTPEQRLDRLRAELRRNGADVEAIEARAYAEDGQ